MTREEAINELNEELIGINPNALGREEIQRWAVALDMAIKALKEQRPHGEWIKHIRYNMNYFVSKYECSNCRDEVWQKTEWQFCPNCGADMRKEGEQNEISRLHD